MHALKPGKTYIYTPDDATTPSICELLFWKYFIALLFSSSCERMIEDAHAWAVTVVSIQNCVSEQCCTIMLFMFAAMWKWK